MFTVFEMVYSDTEIEPSGIEIDDLFVASAFRGEGYGMKLLLWGMNHIREQGHEEIVLHVAEWNSAAVKMYLDVGFTIRTTVSI